ncbi:MAG: bifunctional phosphoribosylaminoimidazolecarboxamide formyltransferase/IMP cyclohydrolase [Sphingomonadaceae bacterium]|uniref:bifunctional phosphoribosylaminoimidazolecarboxamide formyltransferase/IMP cyclohydrolase n=1 Tax=Thermaurantiacus sp. TaxID=2820283 RepID=UPI00298F2D2B|nr:bifunctional phosphoribosylaminoimidazolecarboxamide formyltransferase/IMP cyclohydrolase [Thermaurantiacus sp.]MCS6986930.1 bifunctional phosphoribosylaminoimidazolecarboxamide formyltransferase/IMP cyclohydrolase [Sphingomonadaceae bacterium]MDW8415470.1 bifunctional phosphoribosylaminoimidazolecarboxamide formyltransferase/IMP cyclohydrolase [Thermaurantiacus sp.]
MTDLVPVRRALLSVSDRRGIVDFAHRLERLGVELVSTGGTATALRAAGLAVRDLSELTGFPEILDGRVKTLHPAVHAGLLFRRDDPAHARTLEAHGLPAIDLLVVNLYPFETSWTEGADRHQMIERIDVGGPAMIRAAAKNHAGVAVVVSPDDYDLVAAELEATSGALSLATRRRLAARAFARTATYDAAIAAWFAETEGTEPLPPVLPLSLGRVEVLRYGENPHQQAALYAAPGPRRGLAAARLVQGKPLSYNNLLDADAALALAAELAQGPPAAVVVKHANPCGVAMAPTLAEAWARALRADPVSAFGGIVALTRPLDEATARALSGTFLEVVWAPGAEPAALGLLARRPALRLLLGEFPDPRRSITHLRTIAGAYLVQTHDCPSEVPWRVATRRAPTEAEWRDLAFAWTVARHVKSNAIVLARDGATVGIGPGQPNRLDSARLAVARAAQTAARAGADRPGADGAVAASDAFFPFPDGLLALAEAGVRAVVQPGGSVRDAQVVAAADAHGLAMVLTGARHFRH